MHRVIYPVERNLDGVYFRVDRNGRQQSICFSDLTAEERTSVLNGYNVASLTRLCLHLADTIRQIGDALDLYVDE